MKMLIVASDLGTIGGIQKYNRYLRDMLKQEGHRVTSVELKGLGLVSKLAFVLRFVIKTLLFRPDFTICANINYASLCYAAKRLFGKRYSVTLYGIQAIDISPKHKVFLRNADCLLAPFEWTLQNALRQVPSLKKRAFILPNPLSGEEFEIKEKPDYLIERHNLQGAKVILTICRLVGAERENKGYERALRAFPSVLESVPNARYILAGGGDDLEYMKEQARKLNMEDKVIFPGRIKDEEMIDYYNLADVFVYPSKTEGFPALVLMEALACGVPVVGGDQHGSEKYPWNKVGNIVRADNIEDIAKKAKEVLEGKGPKREESREYLRQTILDAYGEEGYQRHLKIIIDFIREKVV